MRVIVAPDSFGETLTAVEAAESISAGWRRGRPEDDVVTAPQSDGGPGFVDVLATAGGDIRTARVSGPLTAAVDATWLFDSDTAYIESAEAVGLGLLGGLPTRDTALAAHSRGVGELIAVALEAGVRTVVVGLGGSCCTDGGRGLVEALGGLEVAAAATAGTQLVAATDVEHVLLGEHGAAAVFGPQKGADAEALGEQVPTDATENEGKTDAYGSVGTAEHPGHTGKPSDEAVWDSLKKVFDPEIPVNIVDLGLVYSLKVEPIEGSADRHSVEVAMTLTAPGCGMGPVIAEDARNRVLSVPGVNRAQVSIVWDPPWTQTMISEDGKMQLGLI